MSDTLFDLPPVIPAGEYIERGAIISQCGSYRYRLWREWRGFGRDDTWDWLGDEDCVDGSGARLGEPKSALFVMLNPSTADGDKDDPTIRRCVRFAQVWGYDRMEVVNLFAWRATDPQAMLALTARGDPVGLDNKHHITEAVWRAGIVVCAWGAHGRHIDQDEMALGWIESAGGVPHALKLTKNGCPSHPLYLPANLSPFRWNGSRA